MNELKRKDLHTHSIYSDGEDTPDDLIIKGSENGLDTIAITDHDTLLGVQNVTIVPADYGIELIDGIELSASVSKGRLHILGHDFDKNSYALNERTKGLHNNSIYALMSLTSQLKKDYGIVFSTEDILNILTQTRNIGRPDIAKLLIKYGYTSTVDEGFVRYLNPAYKKCDGTKKGIHYEECIELIKNAGGIASLAHPCTLKMESDELDNFVGQLKSCGLEGIEVYHSDHTPAMEEEYLRLANKYNLLITGGSDYHGPSVKPDIELGSGKGNLKIKQLSLLDEIHRRRNQ